MFFSSSYLFSFSYSCSFCCRGGGAHRHVVIVLQVEVDTTSWNSCIAACDWQIGFHLLRQMQDIKFERCAHTYRIYIYTLYHTCFVVHLDNYTNAYSIYLYLKKGSAKLGFAELQMLRFAWPLFGSTPVRIMEVALIWSPTIVWCGLVPRHCWDGWELCHVHWTLGRSVWMSWVFPGFYFWSAIIFLDLYFLYTYTYTIVYRFVIHDMFHLLYEMMVATLNASNGTIAQTC